MAAADPASTIAVICVGNAGFESVLKAVSGSSSSPKWQISNRYYKATVHFRRCLNVAEAHGCAAVVCASDDLDQAKRVVFGCDWPQLDCKLLVRFDASGSPLENNEGEMERWLSLAIDSSFELIDAELGGAASADADIGNYARAREALEAHLWPTVQDAQSPQSDLRESAAFTHSTSATVMADFDDDFAPFESAESSTTPLESRSDSILLSPQTSDKHSIAAFDDFSTMLSQVKAMRGELENVDDYDERKTRAEAFAERFADLYMHRVMNQD